MEVIAVTILDKLVTNILSVTPQLLEAARAKMYVDVISDTIGLIIFSTILFFSYKIMMKWFHRSYKYGEVETTENVEIGDNPAKVISIICFCIAAFVAVVWVLVLFYSIMNVIFAPEYTAYQHFKELISVSTQ